MDANIAIARLMVHFISVLLLNQVDILDRACIRTKNQYATLFQVVFKNVLNTFFFFQPPPEEYRNGVIDHYELYAVVDNVTVGARNLSGKVTTTVVKGIVTNLLGF